MDEGYQLKFSSKKLCCGERAPLAAAPAAPAAPSSSSRFDHLSAALSALPPAEIIQLDAGYIVARRRAPRPGQCSAQRLQLPQHGQQGQPACGTAAWAAADEWHFQQQLRRLRLLAALRHAMAQQGGSTARPEARFEAALAAVLAAAQTARMALQPGTPSPAKPAKAGPAQP
ncbi:hypothetical protein ABPG75_007785 [Micractinium tetrahymenae]